MTYSGLVEFFEDALDRYRDWRYRCSFTSEEKEKAQAMCCCGDWVKDHTGWDGHAPLDMFTYRLPSYQRFRKRLEETAL